MHQFCSSFVVVWHIGESICISISQPIPVLFCFAYCRHFMSFDSKRVVISSSSLFIALKLLGPSTCCSCLSCYIFSSRAFFLSFMSFSFQVVRSRLHYFSFRCIWPHIFRFGVILFPASLITCSPSLCLIQLASNLNNLKYLNSLS